ncbi:MAG: ABC transporter permease [Armatimonadetes bacterium]|nr:ABC transporter permease [Armatimonadota bacterium]
MGKFLARRLLQVPLIVVLVLTIIFFTLRLSGDPAALYVGQDARAEDLANVRRMLGLDAPLPVQYARFLVNALRGNFGQSLRYNEPALPILLERWPVSIQLAVASLVLSLLIGLPVGIVSALRRGSLLDRVSMTAAMLGQGAPVFWIGVVLIVIFSVRLRWLPASGSGTWQHLVLPSLTLGAFFASRVARFTRTAILEALPQDFVRTARAKGLSEARVLWAHIAKNAAIPVITVTGLTIPALIGGAVITESVFSWPGVGNAIIAAVYNRDYPIVQSGVFVISLLVLATNIAVDVLYAALDPRIRFD